MVREAVSLQVGRNIGGYRLLRSLGRGGMGSVYLAEDEDDRRAVVKMLLDELVEKETTRSMFAHEARLGAQLQHPNIARILDVGLDDDVPYIVMEYIEGPSLSQAVAAVGKLAPAVALRIVSEVAAALAYAHDARGHDGEPMGIVHRDVSPHNILLSTEGDVKLIDFGVARSAQQSHKTMTGVLKGKLSYMSPEQFKGEVDRRSDLFALGVLFYELLAGDKLFKGRNEIEIMTQVMFDEPPPLDLPPWLTGTCEPIMRKALAREPKARYQNADQLRFELELAAGRLKLESSRRDIAALVREVATAMKARGGEKSEGGTPEWTMGAFENAYTEPFTFEDQEPTSVDAPTTSDDATTIQRANPALRPGAKGPEED